MCVHTLFSNCWRVSEIYKVGKPAPSLSFHPLQPSACTLLQKADPRRHIISSANTGASSAPSYVQGFILTSSLPRGFWFPSGRWPACVRCSAPAGLSGHLSGRASPPATWWTASWHSWTARSVAPSTWWVPPQQAGSCFASFVISTLRARACLLRAQYYRKIRGIEQNRSPQRSKTSGTRGWATW